MIARLVSFAAISVMFADQPDLQAGLGLFILFASIVAHNKTSPYLEDDLNRVEEIGLYSSWLTLYGGTLLYSGGLGSSIKILVTLLIIVLNFAFAMYMLYVLLVPHVEKDAQGNGMLAQMARRMRAFTSSCLGTGTDEEGGVELGNIPRHERTDTAVALFTPGKMPGRLSRGGDTGSVENPITSGRGNSANKHRLR